MSNVFNFEPVVEEVTYVNYGEVALYETFNGFWEKGNKEPTVYDESIHAGLESWKITPYVKLQFFAHGSDRESYVQFWKTRGSKKYPPAQWQLFYNSLTEALKGQSPTSLLMTSINEQKTFYASWESVVVDSYTKRVTDELGEEKEVLKSVYGVKVLALYPTYEAMIDAYTAANPDAANDEPPTGIESPGQATMDMKQSMGFVVTLAQQLAQTADNKKDVDLSALQASVDSLPVLQGINVQDLAVQEALEKAGLSPLPF